MHDVEAIFDLSETDIPLDGDPPTIRNFGQNSSNRSRSGKSAVEA